MAENESAPQTEAAQEDLSTLDVGLGVLDGFTPDLKAASAKISEELLDGSLGEEEETTETGAEDGKKEEKGQQEGLLEGEKEESGEAAPEKEETEAAPAPEVKMVSAISGEDELEIPENATFTVKINGKDETVTLAEAIRNYQGKIPLEEHYRESKEFARKLKAREQEIESSFAEQNTKINDVLATFEKNPYLAFEKIARMAGKNPADYLPLYIAQSKKTLDELKEISEAELKALIIEKRAKFEAEKVAEQQKKLEEKEKAHEMKSATAEADELFASKAQQYQFTKQEIDSAVKVVSQAENLKGKSPKELAEIMSEYIVRVERPYSLAESAIAAAAPSYADKDKLTKEVARLIDYTFSLDEVKEIVSNFVGEQVKQTKPPASQTQKPATAVNSSTPNATGTKPVASKAPQKKEAEAAIVEDRDDYGPFSMDEIVGWAAKMSKNARQ